MAAVPPPLKVRHRQRVQLGRPSTWTKELADRFIEVLAESCNVAMAAREIGRSVGNVYKHRTLDAEFRGAWDQAVAIAYSKLELIMLERALHGVEKVVTLKTGESRIMREYNDRVALALLRHHRETAAAVDEGADPEDYQEACERIIERLARMRERAGEGASPCSPGTPLPGSAAPSPTGPTHDPAPEGEGA